MIVYINDKEYLINESDTLAQILTNFSINQHGIAIASGDRIIPKKNWDAYQLSPNEHLTIIRATCGG